MRKLPLFLLALSLAANVALLLRKSSQSDQRPHSPVAKAITSSVAHSSAKVAHADTGLSSEDEASLQHARQLLATDDLPALVARLRAAGFSSMDIRGIVSARLAERYGAERVAATAHLEVVPYWRSSMTFPRNDEAGAEVRRIFNEQNRMLKELLGPDARASDEWSQMLHDRQWGYLPPEKVERLTTILDDYKEIQQSVWSASRGIFTATDQEKIVLIEQEKRADIEALLTPKEFEAYEMRTSQTANHLRSLMSTFQASEEEYQAIYRLFTSASNNGTNPIRYGQHTLSGNFPNTATTVPIDVTEQLSAILTPERTSEFYMKISPEYRNLNTLAEHYKLPPASVTTTYEASVAISQRANEIRTDPSLTPEAKDTQLATLARSAEAQVKGILGEKAYDAYLTQGGQWLLQIPQSRTQMKAYLFGQPAISLPTRLP